ncbi:unnamed protein product [Boreogadus saida]
MIVGLYLSTDMVYTDAAVIQRYRLPRELIRQLLVTISEDLRRATRRNFALTPKKVNWKRQPKPAGRNGCLSTEQYRLTSYRHFLEWILQGERLGRGNRLVLPACVVQAIRANYPTQDGQYRGYQETVDAQDEL